MMTAPVDRLVFVYNADGGIAQGIMDSVHKLVSPGTYACSLCAITHGVLRMDPKWWAWLATLPMPVAFVHKDELAVALPGLTIALPAVVVERGAMRTVVVDAERLASLGSVDALIAELERLL